MHNRIQPLGIGFQAMKQQVSSAAPTQPAPDGGSAAPAPPADEPGTVTVRPGDSLPKLAREHLGDAGRWRELYALNQGAIGANPNLVFPGLKLKLPAVPATATGPEATGAGARIAAYARTRDIGSPVDNGGGTAAHDWHGLVVQDFGGGQDSEGRAMVVDGPRGPFLVRNGFYQRYLSNRTHMKLGAPLEEEHWEGGQVVQRFERGQMTWTPDGRVTVRVAGEPAAAPVATAPVASVPAASATPASGDRPLTLGEYPKAHPVGAHGIPNYLKSTADADFVLDLLGRTGARNTLLIVPFPSPAELREEDRYFLQKAKEQGITVQLRLGWDMKPGNDAIDPAALTRYTRQVAEVTGEGPYLQLGNEPNLHFEWAGEASPDAAACARWWAKYAQAVADGGGYPGLPGLAAGAWNTPDGKAKQEFEFYEQMLRTVAAEAPESLNRAWTAAHPYHMYADAGHPDYVEDLHWQLSRYNDLNRQVLGRSLPVLVTESGYVDGENSRRLDPNNADQARDVARFKASLRERPDWLLVGTADWLLSNRHGSERWKSMYGPNGEPTEYARVLEAERARWQDLRDDVR